MICSLAHRVRAETDLSKDHSSGSFRADWSVIFTETFLGTETTYPLHQMKEIISGPAFGFPVVKVDALCPRVHHEVD
jgi:hypothetical protein